MKHLEHHHRRIRRKFHAAHLLMLPVAVIACVSWIYFALGVCGEGEEASMTACQAFSVMPAAPFVVGALLLGFLVWDLMEAGRDWHEAEHGTRPRRHLKCAHRGYHALDEKHKRHVRMTFGHVALVSAGVAGWLLFMIWRTTR
jgi:hypothetical protein